jgi:predicted DNA-binding transcriptional regulator AlpA
MSPYEQHYKEESQAAPRSTEPRRMLTEAQVLDIVPVGRTTLFQMIKDGRFPRGTYISANRRIWFGDEVAAWQNALEEGNPHFNPARGRGRGHRRLSVVKAAVNPPDTS